MLKSYAPDQVSVIVDGKTINGFVDGTFINISRESDSTTDVSGADGHVVRAKNNDKRGNIVLTLLQTSVGNKILSALLSKYENASKVPPFAVLVKNNSGNDIYSSNESWVLKPADAGWSKGIEGREWTLRCANLQSSSQGA